MLAGTSAHKDGNIFRASFILGTFTRATIWIDYAIVVCRRDITLSTTEQSCDSPTLTEQV